MTRLAPLLLLLLPVLASANSFETLCRNKLPPATLSIAFEPSKPTYSQKYSVKELTARSTANKSIGNTLGQTETSVGSKIKTSYKYLTNEKTGVSCVSTSLALTLSYTPMVVYLAKELVPGTCLYKSVLDHEHRHVAAYEQRRVWAKPQIENFLASVIAPDNLTIGNLEKVQADVDKVLNEQYIPWITKLMDTSEAHAQIDTPAEYARLSRVCLPR